MNKRKKNILERRRQKKRIRKEKKITPERKDEDDEQTKDITMISYKITYRFGMPYWEKKKKKIAINVICQLVRKFRLMRREECTSELFLYNLPKRIYIYAYTCISSTWLMLNLNSIKSRRTFNFLFSTTFLRK